MAKKTKISEPTQTEQNVGEILSKTDQFIEKNLKTIVTVVAALIIVVLGVILFHRFVLVPKEEQAKTELHPCENYIKFQQWDLALNGDTLGHSGLLDVIDEYGSTQSGNLAKAYAGMSYYHLGDYQSALKYLKEYKQKDALLASAVTGLIGDTYVDMGQTEQAIEYFMKAAKKANSSLVSPIYLKKAAIAYEKIGKYKAALDAYNDIKTKYPDSQDATGIDKYIDRAKSQIQ